MRYTSLIAMLAFSLICSPITMAAQVTIDVLFRGTPAQAKYFSDYLTEFEGVNPSTKVNLMYVGASQYTQKMITLYASGVLPDVVWAAPAQDMARFATAGMFMDIEPLARATQYDLSQFYPIATKQVGRVNGTLYALFATMHPGTGGLFYNQDTFDQTGLSAPNDNWTYDLFASAARKLTQRDSSGVTTRFGSTSLWAATGTCLGVLQSYGGNIIADDGRTPLLDHPGTLQGLEFMRVMAVDDRSTPIRGELSGTTSSQFLSGKVAMIVNGYWQQQYNVQANPGFTWNAFPIPKGPAGRLSGQANADGWAIAKSTKHPEEAWKVLQWLVGEENLTRLVDSGYNTVSRPRINVLPKYMQNPVHRVFVQILANQQFMFAPMPRNFLYNDMLKLFNAQVRDPIWSGNMPVRNAVEQTMPQLEALLAKDASDI